LGGKARPDFLQLCLQRGQDKLGVCHRGGF